MSAKTVLFTTAIFGITLGVLLRFAHGPGAEPVARILTLGFLGVVPLALLVLPSAGATGDRLTTLAAWALPPCGVSAVVSLWLPPPEGGPFVAPWMVACLLVAAVGAAHLFAGRGYARADRFCAAAACGYLPVGAAWLAASRMGARPMGYDAVIVALTAVHFHFAAVAAPAFAARVIGELEGAARKVAAAAGIGLVIGIPIVAVGFMTTPLVGLVGTVLLALSLATLAVLAVVRVRATSRAVRALLGIAAISVLFSMPLAVYYQWGQVIGADTIDLEWMVRLHGFANAHGFATCGLLAWALDDRARRAQRASASAKGPSPSS